MGELNFPSCPSRLRLKTSTDLTVHRFMAMVGVGVGLTAGPLAVHARFTKPNHIAITNAMQLFVRLLTCFSCVYTHLFSCCSSSSVRLVVLSASRNASQSSTPK